MARASNASKNVAVPMMRRALRWKRVKGSRSMRATICAALNLGWGAETDSAEVLIIQANLGPSGPARPAARGVFDLRSASLRATRERTRADSRGTHLRTTVGAV